MSMEVYVERVATSRPGLREAWDEQVLRWDLGVGERRDLLLGDVGGASGVTDVVFATREVAMRTEILVEIGHRLRFENDGALREWLRTPNLLFSLDTPLDIMSGSLQDLLRFRGLVERGLGS